MTMAQGVGAAPENHKAEAVKHAEAAYESGKQGNLAALGEHAVASKQHAEAAQAERANPHLEAGIRNLDSAIAESRSGHADLAEEAAFGALTHLKAAEKSF
jgi:hypothetical protein